MKTLNWYITKNLVISTLMALGVLTFVMMLGQLCQFFYLISRGISPASLLKMLVFMVPDMFRFTLPLSLLVSTVLVFSRLSADNEIVAMKSMGISLWQIVSPGLLLGFLFSVLSIYTSLFVAPDMTYQAERLRWEAAAKAPLSLLEEGVFRKITPEIYLRFTERRDGELRGIHLQKRDKMGNDIQDVLASAGRIEADPDKQVLNLLLENAQITNLKLGEKINPVEMQTMEVQTIRIPLNYSGGRKRLMRKKRFLNLKMLCAKYAMERESAQREAKRLASGTLTPEETKRAEKFKRIYEGNASELLTTLHQNLALGLASFSFFLLGLPFGIRSKRSELTIGLLVSVMLAVGFYIFLMLANVLESNPRAYPHLILWLPNVIYQIVGFCMIRRLEQF